MKDTYIPLSVAFLDDSGQIINLQNMTPIQTEKSYYSSQPVKYALEVNQGWFDTHEIEIGDTVEMKLPIEINIPIYHLFDTLHFPVIISVEGLPFLQFKGGGNDRCFWQPICCICECVNK